MIKIFLHIFLLLLLFTSFAQSPIDKFSEPLKIKIVETSASDEILVWIYFTDKGINTDFYFNNSQLVVSEKSLMRRAKVFGYSSLINLKDLPVSSDYINQVNLKGFKLKHRSKWLNAVSGTANKIQLNQIATLTNVKMIDIVYKLRSSNQLENNLKSIAVTEVEEQPENINSYDYGSSYAQLQQINVPAVHDSGFTGQEVTICVMDAGFSRLSHDAFLSMNIMAAWDFVNNDPNVGNEGDLGDGSAWNNDTFNYWWLCARILNWTCI